MSQSILQNLMEPIVPPALCQIKLTSGLPVVWMNERFSHLFEYGKEKWMEQGERQLGNILDQESQKILFGLSCQWKETSVQSGNIVFEGTIDAGEEGVTPVRIQASRMNGGSIAMLSFEKISTIKNAEKASLYERYLRESLCHSGNVLYEYEIASRKVTSFYPEVAFFQEPDMCKNIPESWIQAGRVLSFSHERLRKLFRKIDEGAAEAADLIRFCRREGEAIWSKLWISVLQETDGTAKKAFVFSQDVTMQKEMELTLLREQQYRKALVSHAIVCAQIDVTEDTFRTIMDTEEANPQSYTDYLKFREWRRIFEEDREKFWEYFSREALLKAFLEGKKDVFLEHRRYDKNGRIFWANAKIYFIQPPLSGHVEGLFCLEDINEKKQKSILLKYHSETDLLTTVFNRQATEQKIREELFASVPAEDCHALLMLDVDNFKQINDTYGHLVGDEVLHHIGEELKRCFRKYDVVGRVGGDEFLVFMKGIPGLEIAKKGAAKILKIFVENEKTLRSVSASIGVALYPRDGQNFKNLYQKADEALYRAKQTGKNRYFLSIDL